MVCSTCFHAHKPSSSPVYHVPRCRRPPHTSATSYVSTSMTSAAAVTSSSLSSETVTYLLISSLVMIFSLSTAVVPLGNL